MLLSDALRELIEINTQLLLGGIFVLIFNEGVRAAQMASALAHEPLVNHVFGWLLRHLSTLPGATLNLHTANEHVLALVR